MGRNKEHLGKPQRYQGRTSCYVYKKSAMKVPFKSERWKAIRVKRPQLDILKSFLPLGS